MNRYAIFAYDNLYGGLHGMFEIDVIECENDAEADSIGEEMSREVIEEYPTIRYDLEAELDKDYDDDDWNDAIDEDIAYSIGRVKKEYDNLSLDELNDIFAEGDYEDFIDKYCDRI